MIKHFNDLATTNQMDNQPDFSYFYEQQTALSRQVEQVDNIRQVQYIGGADVAYNELEQHMVGAIVVLDADTLEVVDRAYQEMEITFPYVPGLFSFREVPPLVAAHQKLKTKPDLIVCDGHGIAHPKGIGMASHLGIALDVPTIGCAKTRLVGRYDEVGAKRGSFSALIFDEKEIGRVLRTQDGINPMFVSIGHKVSLDTACTWVLRLCSQYRQPETTRHADALVRTVMKERTDIGYPEE
jgi:deoxyribonuclease V